jgi:hypothetical protein
MFERLRRLFRMGRDAPEAQGTAPTPDPFGTPYASELPARMTEVHAALRAALELAQDGERRGEPGHVMVHLGALDRLLRDYLADSEAAFHGYMSDRLVGNSGKLHVLRSVRARLRLLSHEVHDVVQPRRDAPGRPPTPQLSRTLQEWATTLRDSLGEIDHELLPLYLPPSPGG